MNNSPLPPIDFLIKKAERITAAITFIVRIMDHHQDTQNAKLLHKASYELLQSVNGLLFTELSPVYVENLSSALVAASLIKTSLNVAHETSLISKMNYEILYKEIVEYEGYLVQYKDMCSKGSFTPRTQTNNNSHVVISPRFFSVPTWQNKNKTFTSVIGQEIAEYVSGENVTKDGKGHIAHIKDKSLNHTKEYSADKVDSFKNKEEPKDRTMIILSFMRPSERYSIKDITSLLPGVSEKTVQRELIKLVSQGRVVREGERRWSTYRTP